VQAHACTGIADIGASAHAIGTGACIGAHWPDIGASVHAIGTDARAGSCHIADMAVCTDTIGADARARADRTDMRTRVHAVGADTDAGANAKNVNADFRGIRRTAQRHGQCKNRNRKRYPNGRLIHRNLRAR
jgi:hypothetical protein